uniref:Uncharacterized protein n=1 Tax=Anguilla anguilla TaxID=7936 RepID=A0A0E9VEX4_ANGAN
MLCKCMSVGNFE